MVDKNLKNATGKSESSKRSRVGLAGKCAPRLLAALFVLLVIRGRFATVASVMKTILPMLAMAWCAGSLAMGGISAKAVGLQMVWDDGSEIFSGFRTFNSKPGMTVAVRLDSDGPSFIDVVENESELTLCGKEAKCKFFKMKSTLSEDGKHLRVDVEADGAKAVGGKVAVDGVIMVKTASKKDTATTKMLDLKPGTVVEFPEESGLPKFTVTKVGKPDFGNEKMAVSLKCSKDFEKPVSVKFVGEDGKEQVAKSAGWSRFSMGKSVTVNVGYKVPEKMARAKLVVEYWKDLKKEKVPVKFEVGLDGAQ
jgi:hypothetical protein